MPHPHPLTSPGGRHVPARDLEEVKYWLEIMREHALFMKNGLSVAHTDLISEADDYYRRFGELLKTANTLNGEKKYKCFIDDSIKLVQKFYRFNRRLLRLALTCRLGGSLFPLMLDHMSREALYTLRVLERLCAGKQTYYKASMLREMLFWLRLMSDHTKLISHLLDPSETGLIATADDFSAEFDALYLQARDFASMLGGQGDIPAFDRFILDVRAAVTRLRDFKRALYTMLQECRVIGLIPALLADHMRDEAEHFLMVLAMMEKGLIECLSDEAGIELVDEEILVDEDAVCNEVELKPVAAVSPLTTALEEDDYCDDDYQVVKQTKTVIIEDSEEFDDDPADDIAFVEEPLKPAGNSKFKWSGKWPRPLGRVAE
jgi:hypothetical protein